MGEENKVEGNKEDKNEEEKEEEEAQETVLKIDMHCEGCARKVARTLKGFQGVEGVTTDYKASKVVVKGKNVDPLKVCERVEKKSHRKVELISPLPKPPEESCKEEIKKEEESKQEKKDERYLEIRIEAKISCRPSTCKMNDSEQTNVAPRPWYLLAKI